MLYNKLLYKMGHYFLDTQYFKEKNIFGKKTYSFSTLSIACWTQKKMLIHTRRCKEVPYG